MPLIDNKSQTMQNALANALQTSDRVDIEGVLNLVEIEMAPVNMV